MAKKASLNKMRVRISDVQKAKRELEKYLSPTPLLHNPWLSEMYDCQIYIKMENMQPIGSFKIRGATYKIAKLSPSQRKKGVIAASAGNHAQGVAWGSRKLGVKATIVMPQGASIVKLQSTKALGAEVILKGNNYDEAYLAAREISEKTGQQFIHAFEDLDVITGQGTVALEIYKQLPDPDWVIGAVGGGGLMTGVASVFRALRPETRLVGCQALKADSMVRSMREGKAVKLSSVNTFADGIAVACTSERMRLTLSDLIDEWVEVDEEAIAAAVLTYLEKAKIIAEGSGAVPLAALEPLRQKIKGQKVVLIVSGGNIDVNIVSRIIDRGLIRAGRRLRVNVWLQDRPGSLAQLTQLIAKEGANILQAIHDRSEPFTKIDQTEVELTLETRGPEHSEAVIESLRKKVIRLELAHAPH